MAQIVTAVTTVFYAGDFAIFNAAGFAIIAGVFFMVLVCSLARETRSEGVSAD